MKYLAIIEIPKGSDRRIHMRYDGSGFEDFGPIKEKIPVNDGIMPVHYGYIIGTINRKEKDNVDVIILSERKYETGDEVNIKVVGIINRDDGDDKIIAIDDSVGYQDFGEVLEKERCLITDYFGYSHKIMIGNREEALVYLSNSKES